MCLVVPHAKAIHMPHIWIHCDDLDSDEMKSTLFKKPHCDFAAKVSWTVLKDRRNSVSAIPGLDQVVE
jgi:hypothetical protein